MDIYISGSLLTRISWHYITITVMMRATRRKERKNIDDKQKMETIPKNYHNQYTKLMLHSQTRLHHKGPQKKSGEGKKLNGVSKRTIRQHT
jgi:hypothetical protein